MDFIDELLPVLIFIMALIKKSRKNKNNDKSHKPRNFKGFKDIAKRLREEIQSTLDEEITSTKEDIEPQRPQSKEILENKTPSPRKVQGEITDIIKKREIGKRSPIFNKKDIRNGIIMAEILEKPKGLRR